MNFRKKDADEPDINLIPFIDVLVVVLIFLMLTTTFNRMRELQVSLPVADALVPQDTQRQVTVAVTAEGQFVVNRRPLPASSLVDLVDALQQAAQERSDTTVVIMADAAATHQSVVNVLEAARQSGLSHITFSTQTTKRQGRAATP